MDFAPGIVMFSPLPPRTNGIADYCSELLQPLSQVTDCTVVVEDGSPQADAQPGITVLEATEYRGRTAAFAHALHVYQIGNNRDHVYMLPFIARQPGLVVLHDPVVHHLLDCATVSLGDVDSYCQALETVYGAPGHVLASQFRQYRLRDTRMLFDLPMLEGLLGPARGVIVHSRYAAMKALARVPEAAVHVVPHQFRPPIRLRSRAATRARLGLTNKQLVLLSLGFVTPIKRIDDVLAALAQVREQMPPFHYIIAGKWLSEEIDLPTLVARLGLQDRVTLLGYVADEEFFELIRASDVVVNLRHPTGGETSGTVIRALGAGGCVIVVDRGAFAEIPDDAAVKLRWGPGIRTRLANELLALARDPARRGRISEAAAAWTRANNAPERTVAGYLEAIKQAARTPGPKMNSTAQWEVPPLRELMRVNRAADTQPERLPLWFRGSIVPGSAAPCRVLVLGGGAKDTELLIRVGYLRSAIAEASEAVLGELKARAVDLVLLVAELDGFSYDARPLLRRLNRILAFGGILAIDVRRRCDVAIAHPLEQHIDGTALLRNCGFAVDCTTAASPAASPGASPGELPFDATSVLGGRAWRAVKISEFGIGRTRASRRDPVAFEATA